jgi:seryl-tRNA(Sec) selenium transferase
LASSINRVSSYLCFHRFPRALEEFLRRKNKRQTLMTHSVLASWIKMIQMSKRRNSLVETDKKGR